MAWSIPAFAARLTGRRIEDFIIAPNKMPGIDANQTVTHRSFVSTYEVGVDLAGGASRTITTVLYDGVPIVGRCPLG